MTVYASTLALSRSYAARFWNVCEVYLFRPSGAYSIAICRVALFGYLYIHIIGDVSNSYMPNGAEAYLSHVNLAAYYPKSLVWMLFPSAPPPAAFIDTVLLLARISTLMAIVGLVTRPAMIVSTLTTLFLASLVFSWEPLWSHPYNSGLLGALGFMFGRAGDRLSVDSIMARILRRPIVIDRDTYWWPIILGQLGVAAVYFGGFYAKWSTPAFSYDFSWVFSDNLRNSVALPWLIRGQELPWNVALIAGNPWIWKLCAFGHLATQALPILALFSLKRPYVRLAEGLIFVAGVFLLKFIMGMWNPSWIILAAFFVDWEFFLAKAGVLIGRQQSITVSTPQPWRTAVMAYALAFASLNTAIILTRFDETGRNRLYPFSSMGFYSNVAASKPYGEHKHYPFSYGELLFNYPDGSHRKWSCYTSISNAFLPALAGEKDAATKLEQQTGAMKAILGTINPYRESGSLSDCVGTVNTKDFASIDLFYSVLNIPPYPEEVRFEVGYRALVSRYERDRDRIIAASGQIQSTPSTAFKVNVVSTGLDVARYEILYSNDPWKNRDPGPFVSIPGEWNGTTFLVSETFYPSLKSGMYPLVVRVTERSGRSYDFSSGILYR